MIPLELWNSDEMRKRRENAVAKALKEGLAVELDAAGDASNFYRVGHKYTVHTFKDADDQVFIECNCLAGSPPIDENTNLPSREAVPCYHAASVLIHLAKIDQMEKEDGKYV
jgi:hypothetical protein